jgi:hypothetical protein
MAQRQLPGAGRTVVAAPDSELIPNLEQFPRLVDSMDKERLKRELTARGVKFKGNMGAPKLKELLKGVLPL